MSRLYQYEPELDSSDNEDDSDIESNVSHSDTGEQDFDDSECGEKSYESIHNSSSRVWS